MPGVGSHEVIIETRAHDARLGGMSSSDVARVVGAWRTRYRALMGRPEVRAVVVFKNFGPRAGTSLEHPHSQIVATPVFLRLLRRLVATRHFSKNRTCVYCDLLAASSGRSHRASESGFVAFTPFASASEYETWIVPRGHGSSFGDLGDKESADSPSLVEITGRLFWPARPDWNLVVYLPEDGQEGVPLAHQDRSRLTTQAGFRWARPWGSAPVTPEDAAAASGRPRDLTLAPRSGVPGVGFDPHALSCRSTKNRLQFRHPGREAVYPGVEPRRFGERLETATSFAQSSG
jgi:UDPglucose--hexose-1-phosphate uridylyltransferase